jgi:uncharacterized delta-60 repeat protein
MEVLEDRTAPALTLSVSPTTFVETAGANAATGTVTRDGDLSQPLVVALGSSDTSHLTVPATVTVAAQQASASFAVAAVTDGTHDGPQPDAVTAAARTDGGTGPLVGYVGQAAFTPYQPAAAAAQTDGKWVVAGSTRYNASSNNTNNVFVTRLQADGTLDTTFGASGVVVSNVNNRTQKAYGVLVQPDGKILVLAYGNVYGPSTAPQYDVILFRYNSDGSPDTTFGTSGVALITGNSSPVFSRSVTGFALQSDGKIVVVGVGQSTALNTDDFAVARFNADGTVDTTFGTNGWNVTDHGGLEDAYGVALQADGSIVVVGSSSATADAQLLARYTPAGQLDPTFGVSGWVSTDLHWGIRDAAYGVVIDSAGRIITSGGTQVPGNPLTVVLTRYLPSGTVDTTFGTSGFYFANNQYGTAQTPGILLQLPDGRLVTTIASSGSYGPAGIMEFAPNGALLGTALQPNTFFGNGPLAISPDGQTVVGVVDFSANQQGWMNRFQLVPGTAIESAIAQVTVTDSNPISLSLTVNPATVPGSAGPNAATATLTRINSDATLPLTVTLTNSDPSVATIPTSITFAPGQKTLTFPVGAVDDGIYDGTQTATLSAACPDGQGATATATATLSVTEVDPPPGTPTLSLTLGAPIPEQGGPNFRTATVTRSGGDQTQPLTVNLSSSNTAALTVPATVTIAANQTSVTFGLSPVDNFVVDGTRNVTVTASVRGTTVTGSFTSNWAAGPLSGPAAAVVTDPAGNIYLANTELNALVVRRYLSSGGLDTSWGISGVTQAVPATGLESAQALYRYPDGRVLVVGNGPGVAVLARFTATGALDPTFGTGGTETLALASGSTNEARGVTVGPDGKIYLAGTVAPDTVTFMDYAVARLNSDGSLDTGFGTSGVTPIDFAQGGDRAYAIALQSDGKVVVVGQAGAAAGGTVFGLARLTTAGALDPTFGTGGKVMVNLPGSNDGADDVLIRGDGRILVAGWVSRAGISPPLYDAGLVQINSDGTPDQTFGVGGVRVQSDYGGSYVFGPVKVAIQADGRVVVAATTGNSLSSAHARLMRFAVNGTFEDAVNSSLTGVAAGVALDATGDTFLAETVNSFSGYLEKYHTATGTVPLNPTTAITQVLDNDPFSAKADVYSVPEDGSLSAPASSGVMANDVITLPLNPVVSLVAGSGPTFGTLSLAADGSFTYTPQPYFKGQDQFVYKITDGVATTTALVTLTVTPTNHPPVAAPDAYTTIENAPLTVAATPPAGGASGPLVQYGFDEGAVGDGPAYNAGSVASATGRFVGLAGRSGSAGVNGSRGAAAFGTPGDYLTAGNVPAIGTSTALTVSFWVNLQGAPKNGDVLVQDMPANFAGLAQYVWGWQIGITSAAGTGPTASSFRPALTLQMSNGTTGSSGGTVPLQMNLNAANQWVFLAVTVQPNGLGTAGSYFVATPTTAVTNPQGAQFNYMYTGGGDPGALVAGGTDAPGVNHTPPAWIDDLRVDNKALSLSDLEAIRQQTLPPPVLGVLANDTDVDGDTLTAAVVTPPAHGTLSPAADGSFTYTPNTGFVGTDSFTYRASDGVATSAPQTATISVRGLTVTQLAPTSSGFVVDFNLPIDATRLSQYPATGLPGITLTGPGGPVRGSVVLSADRTEAVFVATKGVLAAGNYAVTLKAGGNGFADTFGNPLDGNGDGTTGDDYSGTFTVAPTTAAVVGLPDFARGAGQPVNVPATGTGLPLTISTANGVTAVAADVLFDPALLTVQTGTFPAAFGGTLTVTAITGGVHVAVTGLTAASGTGVALAELTASVPATAPYTAKQAIRVRNVSVTGGPGAGIGDDAVEVAAFLGDADASRTYSSQDAFLLLRLSAGAVKGLPAYRLLDPVLVGDLLGTGSVNAQDASLILQVGAGITVPAVPALPAGVTPPPPTGADPRLYLVGGTARPGQTVTAELRVDVTDPAGVSLASGDYAIRFDPARVQVSNVRTGSVLPGFVTVANVDNRTGTIRIGQVSFNPLALPAGADGAVVLFDVTVLPDARPGVSRLNLAAEVTSNGSTTWTDLASPVGALTLSPAPTDAATDPVDGALWIVAPPHLRAAAPGPSAPGRANGSSDGLILPPVWLPPDPTDDAAPGHTSRRGGFRTT